MFTIIFTETLMIFLLTYAITDIFYRFFKFLILKSESKHIKRKMLVYCDDDENIEAIVRSSLDVSRTSRCELIITLKKETQERELIINQLKSEFPYLKTIKLDDDVIYQIFSDTSLKDA